MVKVLVLNKQNIVSGSSNSIFTYKFASTTKFAKGSKIALSKVHMFYSWENITSVNNNMSFSYGWFDNVGTGTKNYTIDIAQGQYSIGDINDYLYAKLCERGHYLTYATEANATFGTSNGNSWSTKTKYVFIEMMENSTYYACQIRLYVLPFTTGTYTKPTNVTGFEWAIPTLMTSSNLKAPKFIIPSTNNFKDLIGYASGSYGSGTLTSVGTKFEDFLSTGVPEIDPVGSVLITCSIANNQYSSPNNLIDTFSYGDSDYGMLIKVEPNNLNWIKIHDSSYSDFTIQFLTPLYKKMYIKDDNTVITFVIDEPDE